MTSSERDTGEHRSVRWLGDETGRLELLDQTLLPDQSKRLECERVEEVWEAIRKLRVRGAPAIGIAAAYGVCVAVRELKLESAQEVVTRARQAAEYLATSRPTAVNLFWALDRMQRVLEHASQIGGLEASDVKQQLLNEARAIHEEDRAMCHAIGRVGESLLSDGCGVLTHCNAGGLATAEYGTALSVMFTAQDRGKKLHVYVDETRPLLQGARLTAWELMQRGIDCTLICDNMAGQVMREGKVDVVIVGADRITANGDAANKIGTYSVAVLAKYHGIPFYVAAPSSTFDLTLESGSLIPIEQRGEDEITQGFGKRTAPVGVKVYNPAFDVTDASLIQGIITERGLISPVNAQQVARVLGVGESLA